MPSSFVFFDTNKLKDDEIYLEIVRTTPENPSLGFVPAYHLAIHQTKTGIKVGSVSLRVGYNENVRYGGNIGYEVIKPFRGHRYALKACQLLLPLARQHGMQRLIITCNPDNLPSKRTCELLGATLIEVVDLPIDNDMYRNGERRKCVFELVL